MATGKELHSFSGKVGAVKSVAFSSDGFLALSGSYDKSMKLWDVGAGTELRSFSGRTSGVYSVAYSPDGRFALSGSSDNSVKLWEVATGKELRRFTGRSFTGDVVVRVAFSPHGRFMLSGSADNTKITQSASSFAYCGLMASPFVIAGLDPAIHHYIEIPSFFSLDGPVKPGHDSTVCSKLNATCISYMVMPPSIISACPVVKADSSLAR